MKTAINCVLWWISRRLDISIHQIDNKNKTEAPWISAKQLYSLIICPKELPSNGWWMNVPSDRWQASNFGNSSMSLFLAWRIWIKCVSAKNRVAYECTELHTSVRITGTYWIKPLCSSITWIKTMITWFVCHRFTANVNDWLGYSGSCWLHDQYWPNVCFLFCPVGTNDILTWSTNIMKLKELSINKMEMISIEWRNRRH